MLAESDPQPLRNQRGARRGLEDVWATAVPIVGEIIGIDISEGMLEIARRKSPGICRYLRADAGHPPFADEQFDAVVCVAGIPYLPEPTVALAQWRRMCRPAARVVFTVPADGGITEFRLLQQAAGAHEIETGRPQRRHGRRATPHGAVEAAGLTCERVAVALHP